MRYLVLVICLLAGSIGWADTRIVNSPGDGYLNLRTGPSTGNAIIQKMFHGTKAQVLGASGKWLKVRHQSGAVGWSHSKYLLRQGSGGGPVKYVYSPGDGYLNLRSGPGSNYAIRRQMNHFTQVTVLQRQGKWVKVRHETGAVGWAFGKYLANSRPASRQTTTRKKANSGGYDCTGDIICAINNTPGGDVAAGVALGGAALLLKGLANSSGSGGSASSSSSGSSKATTNSGSRKQAAAASGGSIKIENYGTSPNGLNRQYRITCPNGTKHRYWRQGNEWAGPFGTAGLGNKNIQQLAEYRCR